MATVDIEDHAALEVFLRERGHVKGGVEIRCRTLVGGVSNKTVLVELPDGRAWVLKQALPQLRVKDVWLSDPARIRREAEGLRWLARLAPAGATTPLVFEESAEYVLAMQAVPAPHDNYKSLLLAGDLPRETVLEYARQFGQLLGVVHRRAAENAETVATAFDERSFFESLRLDPYYRAAAARVPATTRFYDCLIADTLAARFTLVHGDYSPKNVLVREHKLILLDHEVIHWGDGAFDVGFALTHLLSKANHVTERRGDYRDAAIAFWTAYANEIQAWPWAREVETRGVRHTLGCLIARTRGKSPLEYLGADARDRQCDAAVAMIATPPTTAGELINDFLRRMS